MSKSEEKPKLNQIIFVDLDYSDEWDYLWRGKPYVITKIREEEKFFTFAY